ncbi:hypothetical protein F4860DRAFT_479637 [Xylaria cubensis]|nr:hypothetical protein F4860DRAFT_479637 [Xylaria cubensis]
MQGMLRSDEERRVHALGAWDVDIRLPCRNRDDAFANLVRRDGYFKAVLIQAHGSLAAAPCANKCGKARAGCAPFRECCTLPTLPNNLFDGACSSCMY